jgi:hypothetical protein
MRKSPLWRRRDAVALLALAALGCSGAAAGPAVPDASLPPYSPEAAVLFDDAFASAVFGFDTDGQNPAKDPKLKERTRQAEFVQVARVETVSRVGGIEHRGAYEVTLAPLGAALAGGPVKGAFVVMVPATNPSYGWVDGAGSGWVGSHVVVFGRHFRDSTGAALHFRCEPDTAAIRAAVDHHAGLRQLR